MIQSVQIPFSDTKNISISVERFNFLQTALTKSLEEVNSIGNKLLNQNSTHNDFSNVFSSIHQYIESIQAAFTYRIGADETMEVTVHLVNQLPANIRKHLDIYLEYLLNNFERIPKVALKILWEKSTFCEIETFETFCGRIKYQTTTLYQALYINSEMSKNQNEINRMHSDLGFSDKPIFIKCSEEKIAGLDADNKQNRKDLGQYFKNKRQIIAEYEQMNSAFAALCKTTMQSSNAFDQVINLLNAKDRYSQKLATKLTTLKQSLLLCPGCSDILRNKIIEKIFKEKNITKRDKLISSTNLLIEILKNTYQPNQQSPLFTFTSKLSAECNQLATSADSYLQLDQLFTKLGFIDTTRKIEQLQQKIDILGSSLNLPSISEVIKSFQIAIDKLMTQLKALTEDKNLKLTKCNNIAKQIHAKYEKIHSVYEVVRKDKIKSSESISGLLNSLNSNPNDSKKIKQSCLIIKLLTLLNSNEFLDHNMRNTIITRITNESNFEKRTLLVLNALSFIALAASIIQSNSKLSPKSINKLVQDYLEFCDTGSKSFKKSSLQTQFSERLSLCHDKRHHSTHGKSPAQQQAKDLLTQAKSITFFANSSVQPEESLSNNCAASTTAPVIAT